MEYRIVSAVMVEELERRVNSMIEEGWEPEGAMVISPDGSLFYQTLLRFDDMDDYPENEEL